MKSNRLVNFWVATMVALCGTVAYSAETLDDYALYGGEFLSVNDRATIAVGAQTSGSTIYGKKVEVGADGKVADIHAGLTGVFLRDRATISGDIFSAGPITKQNLVTVTGTQTVDPAFTFSSLSFLSKSYVQFPSTSGPAVSVDNQNNYEKSLAPGSYGAVSVKSSSNLILSGCGTYYMSSLTMEPDSVLTVRGSECGSTTKVYVKGAITYRGKTVVKLGETIAPERLLFVSFHTGWNYIERPFTGTIVAPVGTINISMAVEQGTMPYFWGAALAGKNLIVHQGSIVIPATAIGAVLPGQQGLSQDEQGYANIGAVGTFLYDESDFVTQFGTLLYRFDFLYADVHDDYSDYALYRVTTNSIYSSGTAFYWTNGESCAEYQPALSAKGFEFYSSGDHCVVLDLVGLPQKNVVIAGMVNRDPADNGLEWDSAMDDWMHVSDNAQMEILSNLPEIDPDLCIQANQLERFEDWTDSLSGKTWKTLGIRDTLDYYYDVAMDYAVWDNAWTTFPTFKASQDGIILSMVDNDPIDYFDSKCDEAYNASTHPQRKYDTVAAWSDSKGNLFQSLWTAANNTPTQWCDPREYRNCSSIYSVLHGNDNAPALIDDYVVTSDLVVSHYYPGDPIFAARFSHQDAGEEDGVIDTQIVRFYDGTQQLCPGQFGCIDDSTCTAIGGTLHPEYACDYGDVCCDP